MLSRYEDIIESYEVWYPSLYRRTKECRPSGRYCILVTLDDGTKMEFNSFDHTIRDVSNLYDRNSENGLDESAWRKEFGHKLRRAIEEKGISQERLSEMIGISRQMLSRYVRGTSTPSGYVLTRLSEILGCDVRELTKFSYVDE